MASVGGNWRPLIRTVKYMGNSQILSQPLRMLVPPEPDWLIHDPHGPRIMGEVDIEPRFGAELKVYRRSLLLTAYVDLLHLTRMDSSLSTLG